MTILLIKSLLLALLGSVLAILIELGPSILSGAYQFSLKYWVQDNKNRLGYSFSLLIIIYLIFLIAPDIGHQFEDFFGIAVNLTVPFANLILGFSIWSYMKYPNVLDLFKIKNTSP